MATYIPIYDEGGQISGYRTEDGEAAISPDPSHRVEMIGATPGSLLLCQKPKNASD